MSENYALKIHSIYSILYNISTNFGKLYVRNIDKKKRTVCIHSILDSFIFNCVLIPHLDCKSTYLQRDFVLALLQVLKNSYFKYNSGRLKDHRPNLRSFQNVFRVDRRDARSIDLQRVKRIFSGRNCALSDPLIDLLIESFDEEIFYAVNFNTL